MKKFPNKILLINIASLISYVGVQAQIVWTDGGEDNLWSNAMNWTGSEIPDTNAEAAQFNLAADRSIDVDSNFTINMIIDGFTGAGVTTSLYGTGTLTIDVNSSASTAIGIDGATGTTGGLLRFNGNVIINNTGQDAAGDVTIIRNTNSADNIVRFDTDSVLILQTRARTNATGSATGSIIEFNGTLAASAADLQIGSNVSVGTGHDSTGFGRDLVLLPNSKLTVDGGAVLNTGRKFQVNGNAELVLNGADTVNGANIVVGGANSLLVDVNANQADMGFIVVREGSLTIDIDPAVTNLSFSSCYFQNWGTGTVTINGFKEGTIRFGTNGAGLTTEQLSAINGGIYSLTPDGYLTETSYSYWGRYVIDEGGFVSLSPWIELFAYVETKPFIWIEETGYIYMDEVVGVIGNGWFYAYDLEALALYLIGETSYGYSFTLNRWVYVPYEVAAETEAWLHLM